MTDGTVALARKRKRFQVRDCPHCGRTTVVDSDFDDQRCDWDDSCGRLFDISDADLSEDAYMDGTELVREAPPSDPEEINV